MSRKTRTLRPRSVTIYWPRDEVEVDLLADMIAASVRRAAGKPN